MTALPRNTILLGDVRDRLRQPPAAAVDCVVTSPPYFAVRDYGQPGQLGQEATVDAWVHSLQAVCAEVARVLKPSGSLWLNLRRRHAVAPWLLSSRAQGADCFDRWIGGVRASKPGRGAS